MSEQLSKQKNSEITVFLSLILTCICALMCGLLESARVAGSGWYLQMAADSSLDSLMSKFHRDIWEDYHLLLLEFEGEEGLALELEPYLTAYLTREPSYGLTDSRIQVMPPTRITDQNGKYLEQEILAYMKLGIWTMEQDPVNLKTLAADMKEADSIGEITAHYRIDTEKILKLERALEDIGVCLKRQGEYLESGKKKLGRCNGSGFISDAEKLLKELNKVPGLIKAYEREADSLAKELGACEAQIEEKRGELRAGTLQTILAELNSYRTYTDREGERRKQVENVGTQASRNAGIVEAAMKEAEEVQEYIDDWEAEDEDDELDEEPLWEGVLDTVNDFGVDRSFAEPTIKDKKKMNALERIGRLAGGDLLSLVIPEGKEVSSSTMDKSRCPSETIAYSANNPVGNVIENLTDAAFINEYAVYHFANFLSEDENKFKYEQEYILNGSGSDRENLKAAVNQIIKVREAMNLLHLLRNPEKRKEAEALAALITGAAGVTPLGGVVTFFIMTVWAFGESVEDVRILLGGKNVPFIKEDKDWRLSLPGLLELGGSGQLTADSGSGDGGNGMDYQGYLRLFFMLQDRTVKDYRMMDMIQKNTEQKQSGFLMERCAYRVDIQCRAKGRRAVFIREAAKAY